MLHWQLGGEIQRRLWVINRLWELAEDEVGAGLGPKLRSRARAAVGAAKA